MTKATRERHRLRALARQVYAFFVARPRRTFAGTDEQLVSALQLGREVSAKDVGKAVTLLLWHRAVPGAALVIHCGARGRDRYVVRRPPASTEAAKIWDEVKSRPRATAA